MWLLSAAALFAASANYAADEARVVAAEAQASGCGFRQLSDEGVQDCMPLILKQQQTLQQDGASTLHECMVHESEDKADVRLRVLREQGQACHCEIVSAVWDQLEEQATYSRNRSRL